MKKKKATLVLVLAIVGGMVLSSCSNTQSQNNTGQSKQSTQAKEKIEQLQIEQDWEQTELADTVLAYNVFIENYPSSKQASIARHKVRCKEIQMITDQSILKSLLINEEEDLNIRYTAAKMLNQNSLADIIFDNNINWEARGAKFIAISFLTDILLLEKLIINGENFGAVSQIREFLIRPEVINKIGHVEMYIDWKELSERYNITERYPGGNRRYLGSDDFKGESIHLTLEGNGLKGYNSFLWSTSFGLSQIMSAKVDVASVSKYLFEECAFSPQELKEIITNYKYGSIFVEPAIRIIADQDVFMDIAETTVYEDICKIAFNNITNPVLIEKMCNSHHSGLRAASRNKLNHLYLNRGYLMSIIKSKDTEQIRRAIPFIQANIELKELLEKGEIKSNKLSDEIVQKLKRYNFFPAQEYTSVQFDNNLSANEMKEWESAARYYCNPTSYIDELSGRFAHIFIDALMLKRAYVDEICYSCAKPTEIRLAALSFETIGDFNLITVYDGSTNTMYSLELNILLDNIEKGSSNIVFPSGKDKYFVCDTEEIINALGMLSVYKQGYIVLLGESFPPFNDKQEHNIVTLIEENVNMGHLSFATTICGLSVSRFERIKRWYDHFDSFASDSWGYFRTMATDPPLVHAPENCTVLKVEQDQEGLSVTIEGNNTTVYRNLKAVFVSPQQSLKKDQYIGLVDEILRHPDTLLEK